MLLECFSRPWDIQKYQVISSLPKTKTILSEIIVLIGFFSLRTIRVSHLEKCKDFG
jgi:hypothetical protein